MKPQLPKPTLLMRVMPNEYRYGDVVGYTTAQMLAFAKACIEHEREGCASVCENQTEGFAATSVWDEAALSCARAIRAREVGADGTVRAPKFANVFCSQCGQEFGPGDHGFSHCENHRAAKTYNAELRPPAESRSRLE